MRPRRFRNFPAITPRWLTHLLAWVPVEAGIYRLNRVREGTSVDVDCSARDERVLPQTFVDYEDKPREYLLSAVNTVLDVHTRVSDLYSSPLQPDHRTIAPDDRNDQGAAGERAHQQSANMASSAMSLHGQRIKTRNGRADAGRSRRAAR